MTTQLQKLIGQDFEELWREDIWAELSKFCADARNERDLTIPVESEERKQVPLCSGVLDYFPAALAYIARISKAGNDKHNPGQPLHHARGKSMDHADCIARHLVDRGLVDPEDGLRHSGKLLWRAAALLQEELENAGEAPFARGARA